MSARGPGRAPGAAEQGSALPPERAGDARWRLYLAVVGTVLVLDQLTKWWAMQALPLYRPVPVLGEFFRLTYIYNRGAAFGLSLGEHSRYIFVVLTVGVVVGLWFWYRDTPLDNRARLWALALVTGGALGNLIDRVRSYRGVVDFFDVGLGGLRWPVFNIADIAVTTGALLLALTLWREDVEAAREERDRREQRERRHRRRSEDGAGPAPPAGHG